MGSNNGLPIPQCTIVAKKVRDYVRRNYDLNTSAKVILLLSERVKLMCDQAAVKAKDDHRKTLLERDL